MCEHTIDIGRVLATGLQTGHIGILHEPQRQNRTGQPIAEHDITRQDTCLAPIVPGASDGISDDRKHDARSKGKDEMSGYEQEQSDDDAHHANRAEFSDLGNQEHIYATTDQCGDRRQKNHAESHQSHGTEQRGHGDQHEIQGSEHTYRDEIGNGQMPRLGRHALLRHGQSFRLSWAASHQCIEETRKRQ